MNVIASRIPASKRYRVEGLGITGTRADLCRWARVCGHTLWFRS